MEDVRAALLRLLSGALEEVYRRGRRFLPVGFFWDAGRFRVAEDSGSPLSAEALCALHLVVTAFFGSCALVSWLVGSGQLVFPTLALTLASLLAPSVFLGHARAKRRARMARETLALAEFTAVGVAAGLTPWAALKEAAQGGDGPLYREVKRALEEGEAQARSGPRTAVLGALAEELGVPEFSSFAELVCQAIEYGAEGFVSAIEDAVRHMREVRRAKLEAAAQKAQSKMLVPLLVLVGAMMCFLLGPLFARVGAAF
ncbi:type II secretion system F family protein [Ammonifex degensii]|uniref:type II secretion system F family protein n=1 Tax=Ammonifex degensii TaxID=42838 RepID=UPI0012EA8C59|nr:type II secretion system F family protein [Ammonifex degensii]